MNNLKFLYRFLKEKGVYSVWKNNLKELCKKRGNTVNEKIEKLNNIEDPLFSSFVFSDTPEGGEFWYNLHTEYELSLINLYENHKKQSSEKNTKGRKKESDSLV